MKTFHILNGDCLAEQLAETDIDHDLIICRECLIDGEVDADSLHAFWTLRATYIADNFNITAEEYFRKTVSEFEKLEKISDNAEVFLWFENDLFCQVNMWFILSILASSPTLKIYRVFPVIEEEIDIWKGFGIASPESLKLSLERKVLFTPDDIRLGEKLWAAYSKGDLDTLRKLSGTPSDCFQYLEEVCRAHIDRFPPDDSRGRPERVLKEIMDIQSRDFPLVFKEFTDREGIYGFGDLQIKKMFESITRNSS